MKKLRFIEINYYAHLDITDPVEVIRRHRPSNLWLSSFSGKAEVALVKHMDAEEHFTRDGLQFAFFKRRNSFFQVPSKAHRFVLDFQPDMVLVQGFIFPWQVMALRKKLGPRPRIFLQHHGERPFRRKKIFQHWMAGRVNGWLFSSMDNAQEWIDAGIIGSRAQCFAVAPASSWFRAKDRREARTRLNMGEGRQFLWVGRLNANKDPFTVLKAFEKYLAEGGKGRLHLLYGEAPLELSLRQLIEGNERLRSGVTLVGKIPHDQMEDWYNAADYLVSSSHREGGSYAIMEAMACGCVPIVTGIPASMQMIGSGEAGYHFPPGDAEALCAILQRLNENEWQALSAKAQSLFEREMSAEAIAGKMWTIGQCAMGNGQ